MKLDLYIASLLKDHDCVIVPEFGGFIANYSSAKINPINHKFEPPHRNISFNKFLVHNDGLLAAYVAQKESEQYEQALSSVKNFAVYLKDELKNKKQVSIEKVGVIYQQNDGNLRFDQVKNPALFIEGFGLESFFASTVKESPTAGIEKQPEPEAPAVSEEKEETEPLVVPLPTPEVEKYASEAKATKRSFYWPAAAAISLPIIGYALWVSMSTPLFKSSSEFHYSDLNPFAEKVCATYKLRNQQLTEAVFSEEERLTASKKDFMEVYKSEERNRALVIKPIESKVESKAAVASENFKYHIVGGCFSVEENAEGLVQRYRKLGTNAKLIDKRGNLFRVSVESFATKKEAKAALTSHQVSIPGAWILYK